MRFIDLFCGLGGFHLALERLGHKCVFACDNDVDLQKLYKRNFGILPKGDLRSVQATKIPSHDILCAGFPCQPFSKAGEQLGTKCKLWGDLFNAHVLRVIRRHKPTYLLMENVANLERHDGGRTWDYMREQLVELGYEVDAKVLSPHRFGVPQIRERLYIVGARVGLESFKWPSESDGAKMSVSSLLDKNPPTAKKLSEQVVKCLDVWQDFLRRAPKRTQLPSFPIWTMEFGATYPFKKYDSLRDIPLPTLRQYRGSFGQTLNRHFFHQIAERLPSYARSEVGAFPRWKQVFIRQNRDFYAANKRWIDPWLPSIREFPASLQKFEWNCKGEDRDIWKYVIQFRASGVRVKRPTTAPSLVAMTTTQVPIIGWERRYMTPLECSRLQSMDSLEHLPDSETQACKALGNAVNVEVVRLLAQKLVGEKETKPRRRTRMTAA
jgi:DNA (cytosine-5)-methyltransferase 1